MRDDGYREIPGVGRWPTPKARRPPHHELFRSSKARGLKGVEPVVSDDHEGPKAAIERRFRGASRQRHRFHHYAKNLLEMVAASKREELGADSREVSAAPTRETALLSLADELPDRWRKSHPKVSEHIEKST